jgi:N-acetylmuramoyl-L-alanine amidase
VGRPRLPLARRALLAGLLGLASLGPVWPARAAPVELVVDNGDGAVQKRGTWATSTTTAGFFGADYLFHVAGDGANTVTWPFPAAGPAGRYQVFARWSSGPNRASNATFQIASGAGTTSVGVNQKANGGAWQPLGTFDFQPGKGQGVTLSDKADGVVVADAIRWLGQSGAPAAAAPAAPAPGGQIVEAAVGQAAPTDQRYFDQTRYRIDDDAFWDYFLRRGGARTLGYPVSVSFQFLGTKVQIFQRQVLQLRPDGGVQTLNLLDDGLLPYTRVNGSVFPAPDPALAQAAPKPDQPDYHERALQFVRDNAPDTFDGEPVNFGKTFFGSISAQDAYPNGTPDGGEALLPGFDLELWGLPTSKPAHDPSNAGFIYQRFQRGVMHYDKGCGCTQGLLLADYLKALLTNRNLPADLAAEAKGSKLFDQWAPTQPLGLNRPADLPGSNLQSAFRRDPVVTVDAGHGGKEIGASHTFPDGTVLQEKNLNLRVALRLRELLGQAGYQTVTTRTTDAQVNKDGKDLTGDGQVGLSDDLQARVDVANGSRSDVFVSVHFNGTSDPNQKGTYIFWDPGQPFADRSKALAQLVDAAVVKSMKDAGYLAMDHGATPDTAVLGGAHYYLLSPKTDIVARPSQMPAIICEGLFLTNDDDANALHKDAIVEAIAQGYAQGIKAYFARYPAN